MLCHNNAPHHMAISVIEFLAKKGIPVVPQPPYFPDLSPCDFFLFPKLKFYLKGHQFGTVENIEKATTDQPKAILVSDFQRCY
jgi:transposase